MMQYTNWINELKSSAANHISLISITIKNLPGKCYDQRMKKNTVKSMMQSVFWSLPSRKIKARGSRQFQWNFDVLQSFVGNDLVRNSGYNTSQLTGQSD